jgi:hypothetical protein
VGEPDSPEALGLEQLDGDDDDCLVGGAPPGGAFAPFTAPDHGLVDLDHAVEPVAVGADHGPAQLVHPGPRGPVRAHAQHALQPGEEQLRVLQRRVPIREVGLQCSIATLPLIHPRKFRLPRRTARAAYRPHAVSLCAIVIPT